MAEVLERLKSKNWFQFEREFLGYALDHLNDAEFKHWVTLRGLANDFDKPNKGELRVTEALIRSLLKCSQGKTSGAFSGLIQKKFVKRIRRGFYYIFPTLAEVQNNEHIPVQVSEHSVQSNELNVHLSEQNSFKSQSYKVKGSFKSLATSEDYSEDDFIRDVEEVMGGGSK